MNERSVTKDKERVEIVVARRVFTCWSWAEQCKAPGEGWDDRPVCQRSIGVGVEHVKSTIYPGHESGYADDYYDRNGALRPGRPLASRICMPCANRWENTRERLALIEAVS
jgi:hypothetical protein